MKKYLLKLFVKIFKNKLWLISGRISERFFDKDKELGEYDDLHDKMYYWITEGIKDL